MEQNLKNEKAMYISKGRLFQAETGYANALRWGHMSAYSGNINRDSMTGVQKERLRVVGVRIRVAIRN